MNRIQHVAAAALIPIIAGAAAGQSCQPEWSHFPTGSGLGGTRAEVLAAYIGEMYVAGNLTSAGGTPVDRIARWDPINEMFLPVGFGLSGGNVNALAVFDSDLYAGGSFTSADGQPVSNLARWNGVSWSDVDGGTNGSVLALVEHDGALYLGGHFTEVGAAGTPAVRIARFDGSPGGWSALGSGMTGEGFNAGVFALASFGSDLYAGGGFIFADGIRVNRVARWDG